ncbi:hypothetical protein TNCV_122901 [Trichonephila clavipes]|nr:hypothetical protein TNCV_122901 [Trichonephila clavipes]
MRATGSPSLVYSIPVCLLCVENKRLSLHPTGRINVVASTSDRGRVIALPHHRSAFYFRTGQGQGRLEGQAETEF